MSEDVHYVCDYAARLSGQRGKMVAVSLPARKGALGRISTLEIISHTIDLYNTVDTVCACMYVCMSGPA